MFEVLEAFCVHMRPDSGFSRIPKVLSSDGSVCLTYFMGSKRKS